MALPTTLAVSVVLFIFAGAFLVHLLTDHHAHRVRQQAVQAEWNARSGLEYYLATGELPAAVIELGPGQRCVVHLEAATGDLRFQGVCGTVTRSLILVGGSPARCLKGVR